MFVDSEVMKIQKPAARKIVVFGKVFERKGVMTLGLRMVVPQNLL